MKLSTAITIIIGFLIGFIGAETYRNTSTEQGTGTTPHGLEVKATEGRTFKDLLDAIEWVESKGKADAIGDNGEAVGAYQIHKIYVDDVNRIMPRLSWRFFYSDRYNREKSRKMVTIYLKHYGGTFEEMARKHNGGPKGHLKEATKPYWIKVKNRMESVK
jgi:hypothetical protein